MKILVVDQDPPESDQVGEYLVRNDKTVKLDTATSVDKALRLFQNNEYVAIISEYDFSGKNGLDFLEVVRKRDEFIPFFLFTDKRERKLVNKALTLGATHYLLKEGDLRIDDKLLAELLLQEIEHQRMREKDREQKRRGEGALKESDVQYRSMFESANDAIFLLDGETFIDCNQKALEMFDCTREEILGQSPYDFSPPQQPDGRNSKKEAL
nr:response regulator [Candidatus Thorarchaeota archaeon]NIW51457.1 response regulator [Candidatus Korarchaeota archaeon]